MFGSCNLLKKIRIFCVILLIIDLVEIFLFLLGMGLIFKSLRLFIGVILSLILRV